MPKIFISYRRKDNSHIAWQIYQALTNRFGSESVVFDVSNKPLVGTDFREHFNRELNKCDILLAVVGNQWMDILKQRLNEPDDHVRIEIQAALERKIPVVPVLVDNASVPRKKDLPTELANLSYRQATEVRAGADEQSHLKRLIDELDRLFPESKEGKFKEQQATLSAAENSRKTSLKIKVKAKSSAKTYDFVVDPDANVEWLASEAIEALGLKDSEDFGAFKPLKLRWILVDVKAKGYWSSLTDSRKGETWAVVKINDKRFRTASKGTMSLRELEVQDGTVFHLEPVVVSLPFMMNPLESDPFTSSGSGVV